MMRGLVRSRWIFGALIVVAAGCRKEPPPAPAPAPTQAAAPAVDGTADAERAAREAAAAAAREAERIRNVLEARVFFDYDDAAIRTDARQTLDEKARVLRDNPAIRLRIEGHADERGSTEYNLALGSRRAQSVIDYIAGFGVSSARMATVSYGEERPLADGQNERAWSQNRRAEFSITEGVPTTARD